MSVDVYFKGEDWTALEEDDLLLVHNVEEKSVEMVNKDKYKPLYFEFETGNRLACSTHHRGYMVSKTVDYEVKKEICFAMVEHIEQFEFGNQSVTSLVSSIL